MNASSNNKGSSAAPTASPSTTFDFLSSAMDASYPVNPTSADARDPSAPAAAGHSDPTLPSQPDPNADPANMNAFSSLASSQPFLMPSWPDHGSWDASSAGLSKPTNAQDPANIFRPALSSSFPDNGMWGIRPTWAESGAFDSSASALDGGATSTHDQAATASGSAGPFVGSPEMATHTLPLSNNSQPPPDPMDPNFLSSMYMANPPPFGNPTGPDGTPAKRKSSSLGSDSSLATPLQRHMSMTSTASTSNPTSRTGADGMMSFEPPTSPSGRSTFCPSAPGTQPTPQQSFTFGAAGPDTTGAVSAAAAAAAAATATSGPGNMGQSPLFGSGPLPNFPPHPSQSLPRTWTGSMDDQFSARGSEPPGLPINAMPFSSNPPRSARDSFFRGPDMSMPMGQSWPPKGLVHADSSGMFKDRKSLSRCMPDIAEFPASNQGAGPQPIWANGPGPLFPPPLPAGSDPRPNASASGTPALPPDSVPPPTMAKTGNDPNSFHVTPSGGVVKGPTFLSRNVLPPSALGGHAASHPPGLGSRVLRAGSGLGSGISMGGASSGMLYPYPEPSSGSGMGYGGAATSAAATDFTKRKGWPLRVLEELTDFVHVLDPKGQILFASPSIVDLTGWKPEEVRGKKLSEMVHPDDVEAVERQLDPTLQTPGSDVIMYLRFRCKPDRPTSKKARSDAPTMGADPSSSAMGGDSSSATTASRGGSSSSASTPASGAAQATADRTKRKKPSRSTPAPPVPGRVVSNNITYVVFEFTGHPYFPPAGLAQLAKERKAAKAARDAEKKRASTAGASASGSGVPDLALPNLTDVKIKQQPQGSPPAVAFGNVASDPVTQAVTDKVPAVTNDPLTSIAPTDLSPTSKALPLLPDGLPGSSPPDMSGALPDEHPVIPNAETEAELQCFFCSCRVHPTPNISILDSFLELKVENERLRLMLQKLNMEDEAAAAASAEGMNPSERYSSSTSAGGWRLPGPQPNGGSSSGGANKASSRSGGSSTHHRSNTAVTLPDRPGKSSAQSRAGGTKASSHKGSNSVHAHAGSTPGGGNGAHLDSEGNPASGDQHKAKKKKIQQDDGDYVCADCGRVDSPEWRKGPLGPKTLCNACGLRWAKRIKRKGGDPNAAAMAFHQLASAGSNRPT